MPTEKQIYPSGINKNIKINPFAKKLCGKYRPGHFKGVIDVVNRLVEIINPKKIYLGKKDYQQIILLRKDLLKY